MRVEVLVYVKKTLLFLSFTVMLRIKMHDANDAKISKDMYLKQM